MGETIVQIGMKTALAACVTVMTAGPTFAAFWDCVVPEIDGPAGVSALAALVSVGMIAYNRLTQ
jgi:hypothetical protein